MNTYATPLLEIDNQKLCFVDQFSTDKYLDVFCTLLTFSLFFHKKEEVVLEAYSNRNIRLTEDDWYQEASKYFKEFKQKVQNCSNEELNGYYLWLDEKFFEVFKGFEELKNFLLKNLNSKNFGIQS